VQLMLLLLSLLVLPIVSVVAAEAHATTFTFSNEQFEAADDIIYHIPGDPFAHFLVNNESNYQPTPQVEQADVGFAASSGHTDTLFISTSSSVDGTKIASQGYDEVVAEGDGIYQAKLTLTGGTGEATVVMTPFVTEVSSTTETGFALTHIDQAVIRENGSVVFGTAGAPVTGKLQYGVSYDLYVSSTAYSRATIGAMTSNTRTFSVSFDAIPEPAVWAEVSLGLTAVCCARRFWPTT